MIALIDNRGTITHADPPFREGLNVFGKVYGKVEPDFTLSRISGSFEGVSPALLDAAAVFCFVKEGKLQWVSPDICAVRDLFYAKRGEREIVLGDDFFEVASHVSSLTLDRESAQYFIRHGYFGPGQTFFKEIRRVKPGQRLTISQGPAQESMWVLEAAEGRERTYEGFKKALRSVFEVHEIGEKDGILLSGGCDSGLVAALGALAFGKHPVAFTSFYAQTLKGDVIDSQWVPRITEHLGIEHVRVEVDFGKVLPQKPLELLEYTPLSASISWGYLRIAELAAQRGLKKLWTGQSADSVYNLGPTTKTFGSLLKRFYLSREYWGTLNDISERSPCAPLFRLLGAGGAAAFSVRRGKIFSQPESFRQLLFAYEQAEESLGLLPSEMNKRSEKRDSKLSLKEAKLLFFDRKHQSFLTGRDPRVKYGSCQKNGLEAVLPYTAANMLHFFRGLELNWRDTLAPKRFIYAYLRELLGKQPFAKLYGKRVLPLAKRKEHYATFAEWQKDILEHTMFGKALGEYSSAKPEIRDLFSFNPDNLQHAFDLYWLGKVVERVQSFGIEVKI